MSMHLLRRPTWGVLFNPGALWIGVHYSPGNRRACINVIPWITVWFIQRGGTRP